MNELEYLAEMEHRYRQAVMLPAAERRARHERELELQRRTRERPYRRRTPLRWVGDRLVQAGNGLARAGERLASPPAPSPTLRA